MTTTMSHTVILLLYAGYFLCVVRSVVCSGGPVFVNPAAAQHQTAAKTENAASFVTQTVYGFLDFTTTIGNTVMVFSPQSASPVEPNKDVSANNVIDTKPVPTISQVPSTTIKPTKTIHKQLEKEHKASEKPKVSSVVQVQSQPPAVLSSKVQVVAKPASSKHVEVFSSKVEVVGAHANTPASKVLTKVEVVSKPALTSVVASKVEFKRPSTVQQPFLASSVVEVKARDDEASILGNNIGEVEYDFLSRQPSEVVEETYKVINLKPSSKFHLKPRPVSGQTKNHPGPSQKRSGSAHPTGLVTKLGGTVVKDGSTTVHETSVIGTYISGKYAQVLQSTSHIVVNHGKHKINPTPTLRILKTAAPSLPKGQKHHHHQLDPTPAGTLNEETLSLVEGQASSNNLVKSTRRVSLGGGNFKQRFRNKKEQDLDEGEEDAANQPSHHHSNHKKSQQRIRPSSSSSRNAKEQQTSVSVTPAPGRRYQSSRRHKSRPNNAVNTTPANENSGGGYTRRGYKSRIHSSTVEPAASASTSLYKFKLNRAPGRWQYKTTQKPRVTIRRQNGDGDPEAELPTTPLTPQDVSPLLNDVVTPQARLDDIDLNPLGSETSSANLNDDGAADNKLEQSFPLETIKVEISTPAVFNSIYYELATIKSPYTFQVGSVKNTRYITVTSTFEKTLEATESSGILSTEPLTENILATSGRYDKDNGLGSGIATLPPVFLATDMPTPPLETLTETFSTTQDMLKTHILPVVHANETASFTLVQTYHVTRLVTATKTLPPMDVYQFVPSKILKDFNSHLDEAGSELHLELEFGDENDQDNDNHPRRSFPSDLNLANIGSDFDLSDVDKSRLPEGHLRLKKNQFPVTPKPVFPEPTPGLSPEQLQQLALLRFLNPAAAAQAQVITTSKPVVKLETVYESHVIPIFNGISTTLSTISKPLATVTKTEYEFGTSTLPVPGLPVPPLQPVNPLFPQQPQQQFTVTSTPVVTQTIVTETDSKVLKLTFGAKTAYTTILSTRVIPTVLTTFLTASVPVQPTAAFPGFFPAPYPPFPYVG